jgi:LPXTG-site transpeptidase (sortase) family protein
MIHYRKIVLGLVITTSLFTIPHVLSASEISGKISTQSVQSIIQPVALSKPTHLKIPAAKVDANIIDIGVTKDGKLDVPNNYKEVGWYKYGTAPGQMGSAVLDGHVDNASTIPGPFKHLRDVKAGDDIAVSMSDGSVLHYTVTESNVYNLDKFPGEKVFHETGKQYLKIITCHGTFVPSLKTYNQRLIVTAVRNP